MSANANYVNAPAVRRYCERDAHCTPYLPDWRKARVNIDYHVAVDARTDSIASSRPPRRPRPRSRTRTCMAATTTTDMKGRSTMLTEPTIGKLHALRLGAM